MPEPMIPVPATEDDADLLAKECIARFCNSANAFMRPKVMQVHIVNPMEGFRVPYKPLADRIREVGRKLFAQNTPASPVEEEVAQNWFAEDAPVGEKQEAPVAVEPPAQNGVGCESENDVGSVSLDRISQVMGGRKVRLGQLAGELGLSPESLAQMINNAASPFIVGTGGWIQVRE